MEQGFDPELTKFFRKIMATFFAGFMWLMINILVGLYFGLAFINDKPNAANIIYYSFSVISLIAVIWYFFRLWKKQKT